MVALFVVGQASVSLDMETTPAGKIPALMAQEIRHGI